MGGSYEAEIGEDLSCWARRRLVAVRPGGSQFIECAHSESPKNRLKLSAVLRANIVS